MIRLSIIPSLFFNYLFFAWFFSIVYFYRILFCIFCPLYFLFCKPSLEPLIGILLQARILSFKKKGVQPPEHPLDPRMDSRSSNVTLPKADIFEPLFSLVHVFLQGLIFFVSSFLNSSLWYIPHESHVLTASLNY